MSVKTNSSNMFDRDDIDVGFSDIVTDCLKQELAEGNEKGCVEIVKFIRRFIADVPVTDYRTVGYPKEIKSMLERCGLKDGTDFAIAVSSLDPSSHVLSFSNCEHVRKFLGCIFSMRVAEGPSVPDRLYCEIIKGKDADFKSAFRVKEKSCNARKISSYVLERSRIIYETIAKLDESGENVSDEDRKIIVFCRSQLSGGKLLPGSIPVVPLPVAEMFLKLNDKEHAHQSVFRMGDEPQSMIASRVTTADEDLPSCCITPVPVKNLRNVFRNFDEYMPVDSASFSESSGTLESGCVDVIVIQSSPLRIGLKGPCSYIDDFNRIADRNETSKLIMRAYKKCYPSLDRMSTRNEGMVIPMSTVSGDSSGREYSEFANCVVKRERSVDLKCGEYSLLYNSYIVLSALKTNIGIGIPSFPRYNAVNLCVRKSSDAVDHNKCKISMAREWFKAVHGEYPVDLSSNNRGDLLEQLKRTTGKNPIIPSLAMWIRSSMAYMISVGRMGNEKYISHPDHDSWMHSGTKVVSQVVSTVSNRESRTLDRFIKDYTDENSITPPNLHSGSLNPKNLEKFIEIASRSNVQMREPKNVVLFNILAETNVDFANFMELARNAHSSIGNLNDLLHKELLKNIVCAMAGDSIAKIKSTERYKRISKLGTSSHVIGIMDNVIKGEYVKTRAGIEPMPDSHGRMILSVNVPEEIAMACLMFSCEESMLPAINEYITTRMENVISVTENGWRREIYEFLSKMKDRETLGLYDSEKALASMLTNSGATVYADWNSSLFQLSESYDSEFYEIEEESMDKLDPN